MPEMPDNTNMNNRLCFTLLENSPTFVVILDENKSIYWINQSFCDYVGLERGQVIGRSQTQMKEPCMQDIAGLKHRVQLFAGILDKWLELQDVMKIRESTEDGSDGQELTVCYYTDVTALIETEKQLLQLENTLSHKMSHDPVTGMLSHHSMFQTLSSEVSRSRRYNNPLSLILMNINYHSDASAEQDSPEQKEQVRLMISQLLKDQMRWADIVGHLDGYDFVLLLPETVYESAEVLVKKLKQRLQSLAVDKIDISYGISQWQKGDDVRLFITRAADNISSESIR